MKRGPYRVRGSRRGEMLQAHFTMWQDETSHHPKITYSWRGRRRGDGVLVVLKERPQTGRGWWTQSTVPLRPRHRKSPALTLQVITKSGKISPPHREAERRGCSTFTNPCSCQIESSISSIKGVVKRLQIWGKTADNSDVCHQMLTFSSTPALALRYRTSQSAEMSWSFCYIIHTHTHGS